MSHSLDKCFLGFPYNQEKTIFDFHNASPYQQELSPELKSADQFVDLLEIEAFSSPNSNFVIDRDLIRSREYFPVFSDEKDFFSFLKEDSFDLDSREEKKENGHLKNSL